ncbi:hypothetical protein [Bremerella sp. P1]|uniref:hypothetical protein n=1 Tax=Bremerella sp. P1 TaxID=3026424 RepID=UPI002367A051|nr:hypothetical protein [Bremerella sp. P1]WDI44594.1 hypothetical protein PSR63_11680 [Bremerella sp. P1]
MRRLYQYVGPEHIRESSHNAPPGSIIHSLDDLHIWLDSHAHDAQPDGSITATFVIDQTGFLRLAPRQSEHVACASGGPVLSAGEMTFDADGEVIAVTNQSTGFCPEPESWPTVESALDKIGIVYPGTFTQTIIFRRCPGCGERSIVKDDWYVCELCGSELPTTWNFEQ